MPCKHYKEALIKAAASGSEPRGELRAHLDACAACRAAFELERSLFASIDAGLQVTANPEVPASLLPSVRARLDEVSAPRRGWFANRLVLASAAVLVVAFIAARAVWSPNIVQKPVEVSGNASALPKATSSPRNQIPVIAPPLGKNSDSQRQLAIARNPAEHATSPKGTTMPEVLVPRDQEVLLVEYAEQWRLHKRAPLVAKDADATVLAPLQVAPIQIAELDVKPLAEEISQ
jgi:hypothetical protein